MKKSRIKSIVLLLAVCMLTTAAGAKNYVKKLRNAKGIEVVYTSSYKGKAMPGQLLMQVSGDQVVLTTVAPEEEGEEMELPEDYKAPLIKRFVDYKASKSYQLAELADGRVISSETSFELGKGLKEAGEGEVLGLKCRIVRTSINSNTIEVWYTCDLPFRGTPQSQVGVPDGLVLKTVRNGEAVIEATAIEPVKKEMKLFPETWGEQLEASDFQYALNQSGVITVPVFSQEKICFNGAKLPEQLEADKVYPCAGGTIILKKVKLPASVKCRSIFAEVVQYSKGDAYDRTGSVFVIPTGKEKSFLDAIRDLKSVPSFTSEGKEYPALVSTDAYDAPVELMRFFTGFGVRQFNHVKVPGQDWVDSVLYKMEVTSLAEQLKGEVWIGAYIGNWDGNGHRLSLKLKYYPDEPRRIYKTMPLFNTVNYIEQAGQAYPIFQLKDSLRMTFTMPERAENVRLFYLTTGHGGWGGGDEFNPKPNTIYLDGKQVISFVPWRDDCGTYRNQNPCSGNFPNGLSSSDLSRSNWCPSTATNPEYIYLGDLEAGEHTIVVQIPQGAPEGGSNSYWCVSGTLLY